MAKWSSFWPVFFMAATSHLGCRPRPLHVSVLLAGLRYLGLSLRPASLLAPFIRWPFIASFTSDGVSRYLTNNALSCLIPDFSLCFRASALASSSRIWRSMTFNDAICGIRFLLDCGFALPPIPHVAILVANAKPRYLLITRRFCAALS